jgi:shikimate dehydrogenase
MNVFGLIGYPLSHSFSKTYFNDKFEKEGLGDFFFEVYPIESVGLLTSLIMNTPGLKGLAVTIPYKQSVIPLLHSVSEEALKIGAVNCIKILDDEWIGYNTDVVGFERSLVPLLHPSHQKALVLGTGGASLAVQYILRKLGIDCLVVSRDPGKTHAAISYGEIDKTLLNDHTLIINCTPLGMSPWEDAMPELPYEHISSRHLMYDLIYNPAETRFLQMGKAKNAFIKNGYEMLLIQAEENWKIWTTTGPGAAQL